MTMMEKIDTKKVQELAKAYDEGRVRVEEAKRAYDFANASAREASAAFNRAQSDYKGRLVALLLALGVQERID